jgi:ABC-type uncharacterized transport system permease subunit
MAAGERPRYARPASCSQGGAGLGNPYHPWSRLCLVVALAAVGAAFAIVLNGVGTAIEQRHSRRQLQARPGPGGRTL